MAVQRRPLQRRAQQKPSERSLQQGDLPGSRFHSTSAILPALARPTDLDLAETLAYKFVVAAMRSAMQRQTQAESGYLVARQEQPVTPKIFETGPKSAQAVEERIELKPASDLQRKQMMPLQTCIMVWPARTIDRAKR